MLGVSEKRKCFIDNRTKAFVQLSFFYFNTKQPHIDFQPSLLNPIRIDRDTSISKLISQFQFQFQDQFQS